MEKQIPGLPGAAKALFPGDGGPLWVFAYGSLMWRPDFEPVESCLVTLDGWHRRFCVWSHVWRGTPDRPGLVLGLDTGGACQGLALRVRDGEEQAVIEKLWAREMVTDVYAPRRVDVRVDEGPRKGERLVASTFCVVHGHHQYAGAITHEQAAETILAGHGRGGPCIDYLESTVAHLEDLGIHDEALVDIRRLARMKRGSGLKA